MTAHHNDLAPWASPTAQDVQADGVTNALLMVTEVQARIPGWRRSLALVETEAKAPNPDRGRLALWLQTQWDSPPMQATEEFRARDVASRSAEDPRVRELSLQVLIGAHGGLLVDRLSAAAGAWRLAARRVEDMPDASQALVEDAARIDDELARALQHALFLTYLAEARGMHVGQTRDFAAHCRGWGLDSTQIDETWSWLTTDMPRFGGQELRLVLDTDARVAYKMASRWTRPAFALAPILGAALTYGAVWLLFALLHAAKVTDWPTPVAGWKLLVLLVFVVLGAALHVGSRWVNVNYDNPIKVYDAGGIVNWLSLRWLGVLQLYIPVAFVVASLWGAGTVPSSFHDLGVALLAGYTADSAFGAAVSKLQAQATAKAAATEPAAAGAATTTPPGSAATVQ